MPTVLQRHDVPRSIRSLTPMAPDYMDLFSVATSGAQTWSAEQWARAAVDRAAGMAGQFVWRIVLGLRLGRRRSPEHVAGWKIADRGERWIRVEATSWFLTAHLVVLVGDDEVSFATFLRYDRPPARVLWPRLSSVHRYAMPGLLHRAVKALDEVHT